jgi:hypothetical protein
MRVQIYTALERIENTKPIVAPALAVMGRCVMLLSYLLRSLPLILKYLNMLSILSLAGPPGMACAYKHQAETEYGGYAGLASLRTIRTPHLERQLLHENFSLTQDINLITVAPARY